MPRPIVVTRSILLNRPGQHSLRKGRISQSGQCYHVTWTTKARAKIFFDAELAHVACAALNRIRGEREIQLLSWVLMPDHFHLVLRLGDEVSLGDTVARIKAAMAGAVNRAMNAEKGTPVWQSGFYDRAIRRDEELLSVNEYVVANPLRAGLVQNLGDYAWWDAYWLGE